MACSSNCDYNPTLIQKMLHRNWFGAITAMDGGFPVDIDRMAQAGRPRPDLDEVAGQKEGGMAYG